MHHVRSQSATARNKVANLDTYCTLTGKRWNSLHLLQLTNELRSMLSFVHSHTETQSQPNDIFRCYFRFYPSGRARKASRVHWKWVQLEESRRDNRGKKLYLWHRVIESHIFRFILRMDWVSFAQSPEALTTLFCRLPPPPKSSRMFKCCTQCVYGLFRWCPNDEILGIFHCEINCIESFVSLVATKSNSNIKWLKTHSG